MLKEPTGIKFNDQKINPKIQEIIDLTPDKRSSLLSYSIYSDLKKPRHYSFSNKPQWLEKNSEGDKFSEIIEKDEQAAQAIISEVIKLYWNDRQKKSESAKQELNTKELHQLNNEKSAYLISSLSNAFEFATAMENVVEENFLDKFAWLERLATELEEKVAPYRELLANDPDNQEFKKAIASFEPRFEKIKLEEARLKHCQQAASKAVEAWYKKEEKK